MGRATPAQTDPTTLTMAVGQTLRTAHRVRHASSSRMRRVCSWSVCMVWVKPTRWLWSKLNARVSSARSDGGTMEAGDAEKRIGGFFTRFGVVVVVVGVDTDAVDRPEDGLLEVEARAAGPAPEGEATWVAASEAEAEAPTEEEVDPGASSFAEVASEGAAVVVVAVDGSSSCSSAACCCCCCSCCAVGLSATSMLLAF